MILIIDNYDSFTYNLAQQVESLGETVQVAAHDAITILEIEKMAPRKIIISPGPKTPDDSGISLAVISRFHRQVPILGVCLGHQCIGQLFGAEVTHAQSPVHGETSPIYHHGTGLFAALPSPFEAARYHSLVLESPPEDFTVTAWTKDRIIMGIQHTVYPLYGVQFHPESFMTEYGSQLMRNFIYET